MRRWPFKHTRCSFPQNYVFRKPEIGTLIFGLFCFAFLLLYRPLQTSSSLHFGYTITMALYTLTASAATWVSIKLLKHTTLLSTTNGWTFIKEILAALAILGISGVAVFAIGFVLESTESRWTLFTFADAIEKTMLTGIIPFLFFTAISASTSRKSGEVPHEEKEKTLHIKSQLKKEELKFLPSQLLYAEAEGNYVTFHLLYEKGIKKKSIRNSISQIEDQLNDYPHFIRTHRAFIVNLKHVIGCQGNSAGYKLKMENLSIEIPVSRQKAEVFEAAYRQQCNSDCR